MISHSHQSNIFECRTDPHTQIGVHPEHFLQIGLIDDVQAGLLAEPIERAREAVRREDWLAGLDARSDMFSMLSVFTGGINWCASSPYPHRLFAHRTQTISA